jgi:glycosyltransferase involved in cell wall biosynthesis
MPKVSILTPCYRCENYIGATLASVRDQELPDWEHIVVDDGSPDDGAMIIETAAKIDPRIRLIRQQNGGVAKARNVAFAQAAPDSEYLLFLDADDCLEPSMLAEMTAYLEKRPEVGMVYCAPSLIDEAGNALDREPATIGWSARYIPCGWTVCRIPDEKPETPFCSLYAATTVVPSISLIRRSIYERTRLWDEDFGHLYEDLDVFLQIALLSKVHFLKRKLVRYRYHPEQSTANREKLHLQEEKLYQKWDRLQPSLPLEQQRVVEAAKRFREHRMIPISGWRGGIRSWQVGKRMQAIRFWIGAGRRYLASLFTPMRVEGGA